MMNSKSRRRRSDRNHVIYRLICEVDGSCYIGITNMRDRNPKKSVHVRWLQHLSRSRTETKSWALYRYLRKYKADKWKVEVIEVVRGKKQTHERETFLIEKINPYLNTRARNA